MSIIEVKGTRSDASETKSSRRYDIESEGKGSNSPFIIGAALSMLLIYWQSAFNSWANAAPAEQPDQPKDDLTAPHEDSVSAEVSSDDFEKTSAAQVPTFEAPEYASFAISRKAPLRTSTLLNNDDTLQSVSQFAPLEIRNMMSRGTAVGFSIYNANDNGLVGFTSSSGAGSVSRAQTSASLFEGLPDDEDDLEDRNGAINRRPTVAAAIQLRDQFFSLAAVFGLSDLLQGATDPNGDMLSISNLRASQGQITFNETGYSFIAAEPGLVTFTYTITDGQLNVEQSAQLNVIEKAIIRGTDGSDTLSGDDVADRIEADAGDDVIFAGGNNDIISGGEGNDTIHGGEGNDLIYGGTGHDIIYGGSGNDTIFGGTGNDILLGEDGDDLLRGEEGNDDLFGGSGDDLLEGGAGNDTLSDGEGRDSVSADQGDDLVYAFSDNNTDVLDGGEGRDTLSYAVSDVGVEIDLNAGTVISQSETTTEIDLISNFESFEGTQHDDQFVAEVSSENAIDQTFFGGAGLDALNYTSAVEDIIFNIASGEASSAEIGTDSFDEIEVFESGSGDDVFNILSYQIVDASQIVVTDLTLAVDGGEIATAIMEFSAEVLEVTAEDQFFSGGQGEDTLNYQAAEAAIVVEVAQGTATGEEIGSDTFDEIEVIETGSGDDMFIAAADASATVEQAAAVSEDQTFIGGAGLDTLNYTSAVEDIIFNIASGEASSAEIGTDSFDGVEVFESGSGDDLFNVMSYQSVTLENTFAPNLTSVVDGSEITTSYLELSAEELETLSQDQTFDGSAGTDSLIYDAAEQAISVNIAEGVATGAEIGTDTFENIEIFKTGAGDDTIIAATAETVSITAATTVAEDQTFVAGDGFDVLSYANAQDDLLINVSEGTACGDSIGHDQFSGVEHITTGSGDDTIIVGVGTISLDGGKGDDMFVFQTDAALEVDARSNTQIQNFDVGDTIRISKWDIFDDAIDEIEDLFADVYGNDSNTFEDGGIPIRVRHELFEELWETFVDADLDRDDVFEISIQIDGRHDLIIISNQTNTNPDNVA